MFNYSLGLRTEFSLDGVVSILTDLLGVQELPETEERHPGLYVDADEVFHPAQESVFQGFLGTPVTARVYYLMNSRDKDQLWRSERLMAVSAARLAVETDALAFMTFDLDSLVMRRTNGLLYLYGSFNAWKDPEVISQIPEPWIMTDDVHEGLLPEAARTADRCGSRSIKVTGHRTGHRQIRARHPGRLGPAPWAVLDAANTMAGLRTSCWERRH